MHYMCPYAASYHGRYSNLIFTVSYHSMVRLYSMAWDSIKLDILVYIATYRYSPLGFVVKVKGGHLTWTAWVRFQPFPDADYLLC
jgi:hypothetical protein